MSKPKEFHFKGQKEDEQIKLLLRRHWFTLVPPVLKRFVIIFLPFLILFFLFPSFILKSIFFSILFLLWFVMGISAILYEWIIWYYDIYIITNKRIIDIDQKTLFSRSVAEASLDKVQDVTFEIDGVIPTFLNYGDVSVQTAGAEEVVNLEEVHDPREVQGKIMELQKKYEEEGGGPVTVEELVELIKEEREKKKEK
jgi:membrane protein YdbS with pleckstrin-like domain